MRRSRLAAYSTSLLLAAVVALTGATTAQASQQRRRHRLRGPRRLLLLRASAPAATTAPAATASAARRPTRTSGPPPIHPRRSPSPLARAPVRVMFSPSQLGPAQLRHRPRLHHRRRQRRRLRRRHDHLRAPVRQPPASTASTRRRRTSTRPCPASSTGLHGDQRQGPGRPRRRPRLPPLLQAGRHLPAGLTEAKRTAINGAADYLNTAIAKRAADHGFTFARRPPRLHRPRDLLRQRLAAQRQLAEHRRVVPPDRRRPVRRLSAGLHQRGLTGRRSGLRRSSVGSAGSGVADSPRVSAE